MFQFPCRRSDDSLTFSRTKATAKKSYHEDADIFQKGSPIPQSGKIIAVVLSHSVNVMDVV